MKYFLCIGNLVQATSQWHAAAQIHYCILVACMRFHLRFEGQLAATDAIIILAVSSLKQGGGHFAVK